MNVDVGKQTTALRRVENAAVSEQLCFSLLTKEQSGSGGQFAAGARRPRVVLFARVGRGPRAELARHLPRTVLLHVQFVRRGGSQQPRRSG